jgi:acetoin utilization deacetylase AcuC-like enzyme
VTLANALADLWPLSSTFEWADEVGAAMQERLLLRDRSGLDSLPVGQARAFAYLQALEERLPMERLAEEIVPLLRFGPEYWRRCLLAEQREIRRDWSSREHLWLEPVALQRHERVLLFLDRENDAGLRPGEGYGDTRRWIKEALAFAAIDYGEPAAVRWEALERAHDRRYLSELVALSKRRSPIRLTPETIVWPGSWERLLRAAGTVIGGVEAALEGRAGPILCLPRPGSHHAGRRRGGGTCLLNHLAVAALWAKEERGAQRVAVLDLDAHHGNGTEEILSGEETLLTVSVHQGPDFYPGTGVARSAPGCLSLPVSERDDWLAAVRKGLDAVRALDPELILIQFSSDGHSADPASSLRLDGRHYREAASEIFSLGKPTVWEIGSALSRRGFLSAVREIVRAGHDAR